jgi:uncharacterized protein
VVIGTPRYRCAQYRPNISIVQPQRQAGVGPSTSGVLAKPPMMCLVSSRGTIRCLPLASPGIIMSLSMSTVGTQSFLTTLGALSKILDKAAAHCAAKKIDQAVLLQTRLTPDMFPFVKQVQITCDFAKNTLGRLTGEPPKFPDDEKTLDDLKARIAKTIDYVNSFKPEQIDGTEEKEVTFPIGPQQTLTLKGAQYLIAFALPNFYFHATTAYDILRQCGVEIGKRDFLGRT